MLEIYFLYVFLFGGERGIRILGSIATTHAFQAGAFNHSATSPAYIAYNLLIDVFLIKFFCSSSIHNSLVIFVE